MKELKVGGVHSKGNALVDDDVYEWASKLTWWGHKSSGRPYSCIRVGDKNVKFSLVHCVVGKPIGKNTVVDHIDRDPLNNQRANLRYCSQTENTRNSSLAKTNTSGFKGVSYKKRTRSYEANVVVHLGRFKTAEEAARAYDEYVKAHWIGPVYLNFP